MRGIKTVSEDQSTHKRNYSASYVYVVLLNFQFVVPPTNNAWVPGVGRSVLEQCQTHKEQPNKVNLYLG